MGKCLRRFLPEWMIPILSAVIIAVLINTFVAFNVRIPSPSMVPTLNIGDRLFSKRVYNYKNLNRGDLVIFYFEPTDKLFIKRLIGLPNDEISINNGIVSVNGEVLIENYVENQGEFNGEFKVPQGEYFFLGDNRCNSHDSRFWENPYINSKDIKGKALVKIYPFDEIGFTE